MKLGVKRERERERETPFDLALFISLRMCTEGRAPFFPPFKKCVCFCFFNSIYFFLLFIIINSFSGRQLCYISAQLGIYTHGLESRFDSTWGFSVNKGSSAKDNSATKKEKFTFLFLLFYSFFF